MCPPKNTDTLGFVLAQSASPWALSDDSSTHPVSPVSPLSSAIVNSDQQSDFLCGSLLVAVARSAQLPRVPVPA